VEKKSKKKVVGGFAIPFFPNRIWIYKNSQVKKIEILAHEMAHVDFLVNGFQIVFLLFLLAMSSPWGLWATMGSLFCWVMLQEYYAFTMAKVQLAKVGIVSRSFSAGIVLKYSMIFSFLVGTMWLSNTIFSKFVTNAYALELLMFLTVIFVYFFLIDFVFYGIFSAMNKKKVM
jgi:hypothetical protein